MTDEDILDRLEREHAAADRAASGAPVDVDAVWHAVPTLIAVARAARAYADGVGLDYEQSEELTGALDDALDALDALPL